MSCGVPCQRCAPSRSMEGIAEAYPEFPSVAQPAPVRHGEAWGVSGRRLIAESPWPLGMTCQICSREGSE